MTQLSQFFKISLHKQFLYSFTASYRNSSTQSQTQQTGHTNLQLTAQLTNKTPTNQKDKEVLNITGLFTSTIHSFSVWPLSSSTTQKTFLSPSRRCIAKVKKAPWYFHLPQNLQTCPSETLPHHSTICL